MTSDKGETSKSVAEEGWGRTDPTGTWGVDPNVGWADGGGDGGWGTWANEGDTSVGEGWGEEKAVGDTSAIPSGNDQKSKNKERQREDVEMRDPSPPRVVGSLKPASPNHNRQEFATAPARNAPPPSTVAPKSARPTPLPLPSRQKKTQDGNLIRLARQSVKIKEAEQVQEKSSSLSVRGPQGRADLYSQVIK